jgi:peptide/nickel transport system ATP-binding protein
MSDIAVGKPEAHATGLAATVGHIRYVLGENRVTAFAFGLFALIVLAALIGPYVVPYDPLASNTAQALKAPSAAHWFGTDQLGRDILSRVIVAARLDFFIAVASVALVFLMGGLAGVAGWLLRRLDRAHRVAHRRHHHGLSAVRAGDGHRRRARQHRAEHHSRTAIVNFPLYARVARAEANVRREAGFVQAARLSGNGEFRILLGHVLPNIMPIMIVQMSLTMGYAILNAAGLSFIGLGVRPPTPEWGIMVAEGAAFMVSGEWWIAFFPGAALMVAVFCFNLLGDGLRDIVDPAAAHVRERMATAIPLLEVRDLTVEFTTRRGIVRAVEHVDISLAKGETLAIVGESGSGKSVTSFAVMRILDRAGRIAEGSVAFSGVDLRKADEGQMRNLRGREMSMIFQNPRAALNPIRKVGRQIEDVLRQHAQAGSDDITEKAVAILEQVRIARPKERYHAYPFELSGGMCQRVVIALALACRPQLLIADEPTTGLDVTTQKTVMDLVVELTRKQGMSTILITHDLGLAAAYCDRVVVMEKGHVVETAISKTIFTAPSHPYTRKLMRATPRPGVSLRDLLPEGEPSPTPRLREEGISAPAPAKLNGAAHPSGDNRAPLLVVDNLVKEYPRKALGGSLGKLFHRNGAAPASAPEAATFRAVDGISFTVHRGESVGLVGESGCGKSTTSTMVMRLIDKSDGQIMFDGQDIGAHPGQALRQAAATQAHPDGVPGPHRQPQSPLHGRAGHRRSDPAAGQRQGRQGRAGALRGAGAAGRSADRVPRPLPPPALGRPEGARRHRPGDRAQSRTRHPRRADGGARRLVQAVVLNLLQDLKEQLGMSYLFVSHDLNVVRLLCDRVIVMQAGRIVEEGPTERVLFAPEAQYTRDLLAAIPHPPV